MRYVFTQTYLALTRPRSTRIPPPPPTRLSVCRKSTLTSYTTFPRPMNIPLSAAPAQSLKTIPELRSCRIRIKGPKSASDATPRASPHPQKTLDSVGLRLPGRGRMQASTGSWEGRLLLHNLQLTHDAPLAGSRKRSPEWNCATGDCWRCCVGKP